MLPLVLTQRHLTQRSLTRDFLGATLHEVKRRVLRIVVLLWLGWYISGPLCETVDFWDTPRVEMLDVMCSAGGTATLVACIFCVGILLFRKWRERYSLLARAFGHRFLPLTFQLPTFAFLTAPAPSPSPPLPLRI